MKFHGQNISKEKLESLDSDEAAEWLCEVGFSECTAKFLERDITGKQMLQLQQFQIKNLMPIESKGRKFWELIQKMNRDENEHQAESHSMFGRGGRGRPPMFPPQSRQPVQPPMGRAPFYPPGHQHNHQQNFQAQPQYDDEFDNSSDEEQTYMESDTIESFPASNNQRRSSGYPDWRGDRNPAPTPGFSLPMPAMPTMPSSRPKPTMPNYSKCNPNLKKGNRPSPSGPAGTPGIRGMQPLPGFSGIRQANGPQPPAPSDNGEDYMVFSNETNTNQFSPPPPQRPPSRPPKDFPTPGMPLPPPRSPLGHHDDYLPQRPPPQPPSPAPFWPKAPSRNGSAKDSPSSSPGSSRGASLKNQELSHIPSRDGSTGSSSDDTSYPKQGHIATSFRPMNKTPAFQPPVSKPPANFAMQMPPVSKPKTKPEAKGVEDQSWFHAVSRRQAEQLLQENNDLGMFIVRSRADSATKPYALTLWANDKYYNFIIRKRNDGEFALGNVKPGERSFSTVLRLIQYYMENDLILAEGEGSVILVGPSH